MKTHIFASFYLQRGSQNSEPPPTQPFSYTGTIVCVHPTDNALATFYQLVNIKTDARTINLIHNLFLFLFSRIDKKKSRNISPGISLIHYATNRKESPSEIVTRIFVRVPTIGIHSVGYIDFFSVNTRFRNRILVVPLVF